MNWKIIMAWHACVILLFSHPTLERQKLFLVSVFIDYLRQEWGIMISGWISWLALATGFPLLIPHNTKQPLDWPCFEQGLGQVTFEDPFHPKLFYEPMSL